MGKLLDAVRYDIHFLRSHTLQPRWWKKLKVFVLLGFLVGHAALFGFVKTTAFLASFVSFCLVIHFTYRSRTRRYSQSWLDFSVGETDSRGRPKRIGKYYYLAVLVCVVLSFLVSQAFP